MDALSLKSLARLLYLRWRGACPLRGERSAVRVMFIWPRTREFPVYERLVPTLTIPYLAALTPRHWETSFADDNYGEVDLEARPDLVAISVSTMGAVRAYALADAFRARGIPVVLGGWHVSLCPDDEEAAAHADAVVVGEADDTWPALLDDFERGRLQPRYVSHNRTELADYPRLDRGLLKGRAYSTTNLVQATRGCPYRCSFCSVSALNPKYRRRPVDDVVAEVARLRGRALFFIDDNLLVHRDYSRLLFAALAPLGKKWIGEVSIDIADDPELLDLAAASGLVGVLVGFESILPQSIGEMNKDRTNAVERYKAQVHALQRRGIRVATGFSLPLGHGHPDSLQPPADLRDDCERFAAILRRLMP